MRFGLTMSICLSLIVPAVLAESAYSSAQPTFDPTRAFETLKKQCDFGPRPPGTKAHLDTQAYIEKELKLSTPDVQLQSFSHTRGTTKYPMTNIIARFGDAGKPAVLLCAHWDTRPTADMERDFVKQKLPIIGADDGASGVAVLLELARMFHESPPPVPVTVVLFDGEDLGPGIDDMFLGARYYASKLGQKPLLRYGILLDMIGDKDLRIYREVNSDQQAKNVDDKIWNAAAALGYSHIFVDWKKDTLYDDHLPLLQAGVPCVDIIDFDYPYWHTLGDTPDKCSPDSLKVVGQTIARVVYSERP